jgi:hypothetical protein
MLLAKHLGMDIDLTKPAKGITALDAVCQRVTRHCVNPWCPTCILYWVGDALRGQPTFMEDEPSQTAVCCEACGEPLQDRCAQCGKAATYGAFCSCGAPRVRVDPRDVPSLLQRRSVCAPEAAALQQAQRAVLEWIALQRRASSPAGMPVESPTPRGKQPNQEE